MKRHAEIVEEMNRVVKRLVSQYGAEKVILFGSRATGGAGVDSDTDLVVIKRTASSFFDRLAEVARICRWEHPFEVLVYTPEEFSRMEKESSFIREEVVAKGKVLYERVA